MCGSIGIGLFAWTMLGDGESKPASVALPDPQALRQRRGRGWVEALVQDTGREEPTRAGRRKAPGDHRPDGARPGTPSATAPRQLAWPAAPLALCPLPSAVCPLAPDAVDGCGLRVLEQPGWPWHRASALSGLDRATTCGAAGSDSLAPTAYHRRRRLRLSAAACCYWRTGRIFKQARYTGNGSSGGSCLAVWSSPTCFGLLTWRWTDHEHCSSRVLRSQLSSLLSFLSVYLSRGSCLSAPDLCHTRESFGIGVEIRAREIQYTRQSSPRAIVQTGDRASQPSLPPFAFPLPNSANRAFFAHLEEVSRQNATSK